MRCPCTKPVISQDTADTGTTILKSPHSTTTVVQHEGAPSGGMAARASAIDETQLNDARHDDGPQVQEQQLGGLVLDDEPDEDDEEEEEKRSAALMSSEKPLSVSETRSTTGSTYRFMDPSEVFKTARANHAITATSRRAVKGKLTNVLVGRKYICAEMSTDDGLKCPVVIDNTFSVVIQLEEGPILSFLELRGLLFISTRGKIYIY
jgi:hypothetical protein